VPRPSGSTITQAWFWPTLSTFLRKDDVVVIETGTSSTGFLAMPLPGPVTIWTQEVFGSIGYAAGATVGAAVANQEKGGKRTILVTGDGSLQLTIQSFSDLLRHDLNVHL
jgi:pyruvate decarboxylase